MYYLKLKVIPDGSRWVFFEYIEEIPDGGYYMETCKPKYAQEFETIQEAVEFKNEWDHDDLFEVVDNLEV